MTASSGGASRTFAEALQREAAQLIEHALNSLRTDAVLHDRWWRPSWQAGYAAGLREAHEEARHVLDACGIWYPTAPSADSGEVSS